MAIFDKAYPTYDEDGNETPWVIVGSDPSQMTYYKSDSEAIDRTNWDYVMDGLDSDQRNEIEFMRDSVVFKNTDDAWAETVAQFDSDNGSWWMGREDDLPLDTNVYSNVPWNSWSRLLLVKRGTDAHWSDEVDGATLADKESPVWVESTNEAYEWAMQCISDLADYLLLDEEAYSALEFADWERCLTDYVIRDVARDAASKWMESLSDEVSESLGDWAGDDLADWVEASSDEWVSAMHEGMSEYRGFSGEYDSDGARDAVVAWIESAMLVTQVMADVLNHGDRMAHGVLPLPLVYA